MKIFQFVKHNNAQIIDTFEITNGVTGIHSISRHLCYIGRLDSSHKAPLNSRTPQQISTMFDIIGEVLGYVPNVKIAGHNQFSTRREGILCVTKRNMSTLVIR
ncbi:hypothetical protein [Xanthocytophaga flavus]|uniref:hypothetical protein n=1 Tax=Xanthocytophaga flava TaxID=3048013 RepID=UPI0028D08B1A|nr:hypothetical protein [Xanthocytophaga flavus]